MHTPHTTCHLPSLDDPGMHTPHTTCHLPSLDDPDPHFPDAPLHALQCSIQQTRCMVTSNKFLVFVVYMKCVRMRLLDDLDALSTSRTLPILPHTHTVRVARTALTRGGARTHRR
jgi:hypothetical protein